MPLASNRTVSEHFHSTISTCYPIQTVPSMRVFLWLLLLPLSVMLFSLDATALARRPAGQWAYFHFDGGQFVPGKPEAGTFVAVQDGVQPMVAARAEKLQAVPLPAGTGAVVGICYVQSSGGKLRTGAGFDAVPLIPVEISTGGRNFATVETDNNGYFVAALPPGSYKVGARGAVEVKVSKGSTTFVLLRVGKRMVD
jgi:hypothetical protein